MNTAGLAFASTSDPDPATAPGAGPAPGAGSAAQEERFALVANPAHTLRFVAVLLGFAALLAVRSSAAAASAPRSHVVAYLSLLAFEWLLFYFAYVGLRKRGVSIRAILGVRWRSVRDALVTAALAAGFWGASSLALQGLKWAFTAVGQSPLAEARRTQALVGPHGALESVLWIALSLSAGFCEEFVFRGYLQRQFVALTRSTAAGIAASAVVFGLGHMYQGWRSVAVITIYGVMFGLLAHASRSLRPGMVAHAWQDIFAGLIGH